MKLGNLKIFILIVVFFFNTSSLFSEDKIESVPLINLEELSPTFEEDKDELEKIEEHNVNLDISSTISKEKKIKKNKKIFINITALDKVTAKTSEIRLVLGEKNFLDH